MAERKGAAAPEPEDTRADFDRFDFSQIEVRPSNYKDPHLLVEYGSHVGKCNVGGSRMVVTLASSARVGTDHPLFLEVVRLKGSKNLGLIAVSEENGSCVEVSWSRNLKNCRLDLGKVLAAQPIPLQKRTKARIDMTLGELKGGIPAIMLAWQEATVEPIERRKAKAEQADQKPAGEKGQEKPAGGAQPGPGSGAHDVSAAAEQPEPETPATDEPETDE